MTRRMALGLVPFSHFGVEMPGGGICENSVQGVRVVPLGEFARGGHTWVRNTGAGPAERAEAVQRAASRIGERRYSLSGNNCEHFANWCATGAAVSYQVLAAIGAFVRLMAAAACLLLAGCVIRAAAAGT